METMREQQLVGLHYLEAVTALLQRARGAHPTKGLFEAADLQWWWRTARPTDDRGQLFWFDDDDRPAAAVIATEWSSRNALDPIFLPDASPEVMALVIERGLAHAAESGFGEIELEVDRADHVLRDVLANHGVVLKEEGMVETWLNADARPEISRLHDDYRLFSRNDQMRQVPAPPHYGIGRHGADVEQRLLQTSLYRSDLDLLVLDGDDNHAAHGLFWFDPVTSTGLVEPMRTEDDHQKRGLARHILTAGLDRLAQAGAERIKIIFEPDNPGASHLYLSVGFEPVKHTDVFAAAAATSAGGHMLFDLNQLSQAIDRERIDRGITWAQLSRDVGVATSTIRRFASALDAEADGVLALIGWLGVAPEQFVVDSSVAGVPLAPAGDGVIRVDMAVVVDLPASPPRARVGTRTTIQRLVLAAQTSERTVASLTRRSPT